MEGDGFRKTQYKGFLQQDAPGRVAASRTLRLHKAQELLRKKPELSVEEVAVILQFPNSKHFATQYRKQFHRSPREDRKTISPRK